MPTPAPSPEQIAAVIERMGTKWDRFSRTVDALEFLFDYVSDLAILADAYMHEHGIEQPDVFAPSSSKANE